MRDCFNMLSFNQQSDSIAGSHNINRLTLRENWSLIEVWTGERAYYSRSAGENYS